MDESIEAQTMERPSDLPDDVNDILHYIDALNHGIKKLVIPLSSRLLLEIHKELMTDASNHSACIPGEFVAHKIGLVAQVLLMLDSYLHQFTNTNRALDELEKFITTMLLSYL